MERTRAFSGASFMARSFRWFRAGENPFGRHLLQQPASPRDGAGEVGDELGEAPPRLPPERLRAMRVAGVRQQQRHQHRPRGGQRPTRPPQVQGRRMPVPDRLLPRRVPRDLGDGEVDLRQPLARLGDHGCMIQRGMTLCTSARTCRFPAWSRSGSLRMIDWFGRGLPSRVTVRVRLRLA